MAHADGQPPLHPPGQYATWSGGHPTGVQKAVGVGVAHTTPQPFEQDPGQCSTAPSLHNGGVQTGKLAGVGVADTVWPAAGVGVDVGGVSPGRNETVSVPALPVANKRPPAGSLATTPEAKRG